MADPYVERRDQTFPRLTPAQVGRIAAVGERTGELNMLSARRALVRGRALERASTPVAWLQGVLGGSRARHRPRQK